MAESFIWSTEWVLVFQCSWFVGDWIVVTVMLGWIVLHGELWMGSDTDRLLGLLQLSAILVDFTTATSSFPILSSIRNSYCYSMGFTYYYCSNTTNYYYFTSSYHSDFERIKSDPQSAAQTYSYCCYILRSQSLIVHLGSCFVAFSFVGWGAVWYSLPFSILLEVLLRSFSGLKLWTFEGFHFFLRLVLFLILTHGRHQLYLSIYFSHSDLHFCCPWFDLVVRLIWVLVSDCFSFFFCFCTLHSNNSLSN